MRRHTGFRVLPAVGVAVLVLGSASGCGGSTSSASQGRLPTPPTTSTRTRVGSGRSGPHAGQCHLVSRKALAGTAFDTSTTVPCSRRHNAETASVRPIYGSAGVPDPATLQAYYGECGPDVGNYLHLTQRPLSRMSFVPVPARSSAGKPVVLCDLVVLTGVGTPYDHGPYAVTSTSLRSQAVGNRLASWHLCTNHLAPSFALVDCTKPHPVEAAFHVVTLHLIGDRYPSGGPDHNRRGDAACRHAVAQRPDAHALTVHSHWPTRADWANQQKPPELQGACWFWRTDGKDLPPVVG